MSEFEIPLSCNYCLHSCTPTHVLSLLFWKIIETYWSRWIVLVLHCL